ncbi:MAG: sodium/glutamate symporter, partial [Verrucomicrobiota bacterium]
MNLSAWIFVSWAIPILLVGEFLVRKIKVLARFNIPAPVVGGLLVATAVFAAKFSGILPADVAGKVASPWWTWLVTIGPEWRKHPAISVHQPFLVAFFTCIGLNASWSLAKRGSVQVLLFLGIATVLAVVQNIVGVLLAKMLGVSPLLGVVCGSAAMTGGHGTALGFASLLETSGLPGAGVLGTAAATFGLVTGGLIGGPIGGCLIQKNKLKPVVTKETHLNNPAQNEPGILVELSALPRYGRKFLFHLLLLLACIKLGGWLSYFLQRPFHWNGSEIKMTFPIYMGAMLLGLVVRNGSDLVGKRWIKTEIVDALGSVALSLFLVIAM